jgi:rRNA maturation RNase YbeY
MSGTLAIRNRQQVRPVNVRLLRRVTLHLLREEFGVTEFELCVHLVAAPEMAQLNWDFLRHKGSTDIITFDASESVAGRMAGELFICLNDAVKQAREFGTTWQSELARYVIHGLLHLRGFDDLTPAARRIMKREENRLLRGAGRTFPIPQLHKA